MPDSNPGNTNTVTEISAEELAKTNLKDNSTTPDKSKEVLVEPTEGTEIKAFQGLTPKAFEKPDRTKGTVKQDNVQTSSTGTNAQTNPNVKPRTFTSQYSKTYNSFSGSDMVCTFEIPLSPFSTICKIVGSVQTISYSIHNEKFPVRVLGNMNMKNIVFGNRTIAGSIIFTVFDNHWFRSFFKEYMSRKNINTTALIDEAPPINITISFANEYGQNARLALYGVTFVNEGQVMSINDIYTENTFQFYAKDIEYMAPETIPSEGADKKGQNDDVKNTEASTTANNNGVTKIDNDTIDVPKPDTVAHNDNIEGNDDMDNLNTSFVNMINTIKPSEHDEKEYKDNLMTMYQSYLESVDSSLKDDLIKPDQAKYYKEKLKKSYEEKLNRIEEYYKKQQEDKGVSTKPSNIDNPNPNSNNESDKNNENSENGKTENNRQ